MIRIQVTGLTRSRASQTTCKISNIVFKTFPLHKRCGNLENTVIQTKCQFLLILPSNNQRVFKMIRLFLQDIINALILGGKIKFSLYVSLIASLKLQWDTETLIRNESEN